MNAKRMKATLLTAIFILSIFVVAIPVSAVEGKIWYVDDDLVQYPLAEFTTIQAAINAADSGDTILVHPGTYNPVSTIVIDTNNLVLQGPQANVDPRPSEGSSRTAGSASEAIIDGSVYALGKIIEVDADNVVINGFEIKSGIKDMIRQSNPHSGTTVRYNIIHDGLGDEGVQLKECANGIMEYNYVYDIAHPGDALNFADSTNGAIRFNEVYDIGSENAAIYVYGSTDMEIVGNLVYHVTQNDGIKLGAKGGGDASKTGGLIKDNVVHDTEQDGITVYMSGVTVEGNEVYNSRSENGAIYVAYAVSDITIRSNNVHDNVLDPVTKWGGKAAGILIGTAVDASTVTIKFNNIYNNEPFGITNKAADLLDATHNWWGDSSGSGHASNLGGLGDGVSDNIDYSPWLDATFGTTPRTYHVNPTGTIQSAINAADSGDTILVHPGTYAENLVIEKAITLKSNEFESTGTVTKDTTLINAGGGAESKGIHITANGVTVQGFTIYNYENGVKVESTATIDNNIIYNTGVMGYLTGFNPRGIDVYLTQASAAFVTITNNEIYDNVRGGPAYWKDAGRGISVYSDVSGTASEVLIDNNEIYGSDQRGISLAHLPATITNNYIHDIGIHVANDNNNEFIDGIVLFYNKGTVLVQDNRIESIGHGNLLTSAGIYLFAIPRYYGPGYYGSITINSNNISTASELVGILINSNNGVTYDVFITNNIISESTGAYSGLMLINRASGVGYVDSIEGNTITGNSRGIWLTAMAVGSLRFNNIYDNTGFGVEVATDYPTPPVDATLNWWGDPSGPSGVGLGSGDSVSAMVDYNPWLGASLTAAKSEEVTGTDTVEALEEADIEVDYTVTEPTSIIVASYEENPQEGFTNDAGKYYDVYVEDHTVVTSLNLKFYYTDADLGGREESTLSMLWHDESSWKPVSHQTLHTVSDVSGYSGYIEVLVTSTTYPNLSDMSGTPFGFEGEWPEVAEERVELSVSGEVIVEAAEDVTYVYASMGDTAEITVEMDLAGYHGDIYFTLYKKVDGGLAYIDEIRTVYGIELKGSRTASWVVDQAPGNYVIWINIDLMEKVQLTGLDEALHIGPIEVVIS